MWRAVLYFHHVTQLLFLLLDLKNELSVAYQVGLSMLDCIPFYKLSPTNHHYPDKRDSIKTELLLDLKENIPSCISGKKTPSHTLN